MKRYIYFVLSIVIFLFSGCLRSLEKEGINPETIYKGRVIDAKNNPLSGIMVRITNGNLIYNSVTTGQDGIFQISVDISKIDQSYYIQVGEGEMIKRSSLKGFGLDVYDYGDIPFVDVKLPNVETMGLTDVKINSFTCKCNVKSQGASIVTERGVCWSTNIPTIDNYKVLYGSGEGIYSCIVTDDVINVSTTTYYVRAYAKNEFGVGYGEPIEINSSKLQEFMLPTMQYGGYTYTIHTDLGGMTWEQAVQACDNLVAEGYDDWYLSTKEELLAISEKTDAMKEYIYWSSTAYSWYSSTFHYCVNLEGVLDGLHYDSNVYRVLPVRKDK